MTIVSHFTVQHSIAWSLRRVSCSLRRAEYSNMHTKVLCVLASRAGAVQCAAAVIQLHKDKGIQLRREGRGYMQTSVRGSDTCGGKCTKENMLRIHFSTSTSYWPHAPATTHVTATTHVRDTSAAPGHRRPLKTGR